MTKIYFRKMMAIESRIQKVSMNAACALFMILAYAYGMAQPEYKAGDIAPPLNGGTWLKGEPISHFEKGNIYVLDFSSVLCSPCRAFIPHLTDLAHRHAGRVTVLGVYVYENPEDDTVNTTYQEGVRRFISRMGERMDYRIMVDGPTRPLARAWMQAGGYEGMPTTFVVDQLGHMVWAGYPPGLESVLDRVLANDFRLADGQDIGRRRQSAETRIYAAKKQKDYHVALATVDSLIIEESVDRHLYFEKFEILLAIDEAAAYKFARWVAKVPCVDSEPVLLYMARHIVEQEQKHMLRHPDYKLVLQLTDQALTLSRSDIVSAVLFDLKAQAYLLMGNKRKAIKEEKRAIRIAPRDTYPTMSDLQTIFNARVQILQQQGKLQ